MAKRVDQRIERLEKLLEVQAVHPMGMKSAAQYLGLSTAYLYKLTSGALIPHYKPGGKKLVFLKADLDSYLLKNRVSSRDELAR